MAGQMAEKSVVLLDTSWADNLVVALVVLLDALMAVLTVELLEVKKVDKLVDATVDQRVFEKVV